MSDGLPEGWYRTTLNATLEPGGLFDGPFGSSLKTSDYTHAGVRVIRLENLSNLLFVADKETFISEAKYQSLLKHTVYPGDILVGSFVDGAVRVCVLPNLPTKAIAKADCFTVRTRPDIADRQFVAYQLGTVAVRDAFVGDIHGATRPRITTTQLRECALSLAPLPEQHRIVEKVEALLEQVNRAKERLDRVPLILKRFRQAVLAAACSGELTREWREAARQEEEEAADGSLPALWKLSTVGGIASLVTDGDHNPPKRVSAGVPHLTAKHVKYGRLVTDGCTFVSLTDYERVRKRYEPRAGDLIVTCVGTLGQTAIVPAGFQFSPDRNLAAIRVGPSVICDFLQLVLQAPASQQAIADSSGSTAQPHLYLGDLRQIAVVVPPLDEQVEVVRVAGRLLGIADTIERRVQAAAARANKLPQAILAKAFSGELVPTEAELARLEGRTYETAEELLKRVTALGSDAPAAGQGRGRRGRKGE